MKKLNRKKLQKLIREEIEVAIDYAASIPHPQKENGTAVEFSRDKEDNPIGLVPLQMSKRRNNIRGGISIDQFLDFAADGGSVNDWIREQIKDGRPVAPPWYDMVYVESVNVWYVRGHEGRSRCKTIKEMAEKRLVEVPVDLFLKRKDNPNTKSGDFYVDKMTQKEIDALQNRVLKQEYGPVNDYSDKDHYDFISSYFSVDFEL